MGFSFSDMSLVVAKYMKFKIKSCPHIFTFTFTFSSYYLSKDPDIRLGNKYILGIQLKPHFPRNLFSSTMCNTS
jgi:hypothetical protein